MFQRLESKRGLRIFSEIVTFPFHLLQPRQLTLILLILCWIHLILHDLTNILATRLLHFSSQDFSFDTYKRAAEETAIRRGVRGEMRRESLQVHFLPPSFLFTSGIHPLLVILISLSPIRVSDFY